ncbi:hypothetical protein HMI54_008466 [Coelomomyces lativittatus]|nr:hypothetical protein HMI54_008466 [Coelomomyces lativittatus]
MCSFLYFMVLFLFIALNRVTANTTDEIHIVPMVGGFTEVEYRINYYKWWGCNVNGIMLRWTKRIQNYDVGAKEKVFKFNDHTSYYSCVDRYCCFYENGQVYTNFKNYNEKKYDFEHIQKWSATNFKKFKEQLFTVNYKDKSSGFHISHKDGHLPSVKASTHCSEDQCTWSCEINSKKVFQFQFPNPSTLYVFSFME